MFKGKFKLSKIWKRILGGIFVVGATGFLFNGTVGITTEVHAVVDSTQSQDTNTGIDKMEFVQIVDLILKILYILLWPLLVIAGLAMDNTLVYASVFNLDAPLWMFWNMVKNFANFALGFLVLFAIIRNIFSFGKGNDDRSPQKIITKTLIAGVLIQISWFAMAALIDLSTIATYAVGGLPLNVIGSTDLGTKKILKSHAELDMSKFMESSDSEQPFKSRHSTKLKVNGTLITINLSQCKIQNGYVVGRMYGGIGFRNELAGWGGTKNACVFGGNQIVFFNEFPSTYNSTTDTEYQTNLATILGFQEDATREACNFFMRIKGTNNTTNPKCGDLFKSIATDVVDYQLEPGASETADYKFLHEGPYPQFGSYGFDAGDTWLENNEDALSLSELIDKSKGFVGPLVTMYSSLLNFTELANTSTDTSFGEISGEMLIKMAFAIGLFFPLLALAVVLILRIGFLRAVIVASPFLVLISAFGWEEKLGDMKEHFNITNVFKVIFAPVITVFALSLSLIFMSALITSLKDGGASEAMGMKSIISDNANTQTWTFWEDCAELEIEGLDIGGSLDGFSWFFVNIMAIGLMRAIVFAAIKANTIGEAIGGKIQDFGANVFQTLPILPIGPEGRGVGLGSFGTVMGQALPTKLDVETTRQENIVRKWMPMPGEGAAATPLTSEQATTIVTSTINTRDLEQKIMETSKVSKEEVGGVLAASRDILSTALENVTDQATKQRAITALEGVTELGPDFYERAQLDKITTTDSDAATIEVNDLATDPNIDLTHIVGTYEKEFTDPSTNTPQTYVLEETTANSGKYVFNLKQPNP